MTLQAERCVFLAGLYRAERGIAERLLQQNGSNGISIQFSNG